MSVSKGTRSTSLHCTGPTHPHRKRSLASPLGNGTSRGLANTMNQQQQLPLKITTTTYDIPILSPHCSRYHLHHEPNTLWHIIIRYPGEEASPPCPDEFPPINPPYYSKQHLMKYGVEIAEELDPQCSICHEDFQPMKNHWKIWRPALIEFDDPRFTLWFRWGEWWDIGYKILYPHKPIKVKACGHVFGETCFRQYMEGDGVNKCPYCRTKPVDSDTCWIYAIVQPVEQRRIELLAQLGQIEPYKDCDPEAVKDSMGGGTRRSRRNWTTNF